MSETVMPSAAPVVAPSAAPSAPAVTLDEHQRRLAAHRSGPAACAAVAGSGKTATVVQRALDLVREGAAPQSIVTLAFNANARDTLRQRFTAAGLGEHASTMGQTFHGFAYAAVRLVRPDVRPLATSRADAERTGVPTVRDIARRAWRACGGWRERGDSTPVPAWARGIDLDELVELESGARERLFAAGWPQVAKDSAALLSALRDLHLPDATPQVLEALAHFAPAYLREKRAVCGIDFADMLLGLGHYLRVGEPRVVAHLTRIQHLQIDEAQDCNGLRWYVAREALARGAESVVAVGDLRQSIAAFAGAEPALFRAWWDECPESARYTLPRNYRSAPAIVAAGNAVAQGETWNLGGDSIAARSDLGPGAVTVVETGATGVGLDIAAQVLSGDLRHEDVVVLGRTRASLEGAAFALRARGVPVRIRGGGGSAWRGRVGRQVLAYLAYADGEVGKDTVTALNSPVRYVSAARLAEWAPGGQLDLATLRAEARRYRPAARALEAHLDLDGGTWEDRCDLIREWLAEGLAEAATRGDEVDPDATDLIEALIEQALAAGSREALDTVIAAAEAPVPDSTPAVELSTVHRAKGDQWRVVYVTGVRAGTFPHVKASGVEERAEETRLLYVAVTRAVERLVLDVESKNEGFFFSKIEALRDLARVVPLVAAAPVAAPATAAAPVAAETPAPTPEPTPPAPPSPPRGGGRLPLVRLDEPAPATPAPAPAPAAVPDPDPRNGDEGPALPSTGDLAALDALVRAATTAAAAVAPAAPVAPAAAPRAAPRPAPAAPAAVTPRAAWMALRASQPVDPPPEPPTPETLARLVRLPGAVCTVAPEGTYVRAPVGDGWRLDVALTLDGTVVVALVDAATEQPLVPPRTVAVSPQWMTQVSDAALAVLAPFASESPAAVAPKRRGRPRKAPATA